MFDGRALGDVDLLDAWCQGDRAAGSVLFERYYASVARFFHNKVGDVAQDDLIHETFLGCLNSAVRFRRQARFRTFLFGIAHSVLADYLRRLYRRTSRLNDEIDVEQLPAASFGLSPVTAVAQREEQRLVLEALRRIPLIHQVALELCYWEELTAAEIGEVLGVPLGTAKTRLRDGRLYLEQELRQLARLPELLQSTLDNLDRWARRVRAQVTPTVDMGDFASQVRG
jgi:RNA polymerase sigma-70 factor (ECF subfamily)